MRHPSCSPACRSHRLGRVEVGFQTDPGSCQVQQTQEMMGVFVVAGGHATPPLEPAKAPFHGIARLVSFRVVGLGVRVPLPGLNDGLDALWLPPRAEGVAVIGPVGDQAGPRRVRPGFPQGPGLGAVVALPPPPPSRAGTGDGRGDPPRCGSWCRSRPGYGRGRDPFFCFGARPPCSRARARPCCPAARRTDPDRPTGRPSVDIGIGGTDQGRHG